MEVDLKSENPKFKFFIFSHAWLDSVLEYKTVNVNKISVITKNLKKNGL